MVLATSAAVAVPPALTVAEAQRLAIERSRFVALQDAAIVTARQREVAVAQLPEAVLRLGIDPLSVEGPERLSIPRDAAATRRVGAVTEQTTRTDKRQARMERYAREAERAAAQKALASVDVARSTALAWLEVYYVEQMNRVAAEQLRFAEIELDSTERLYWAGRVAQPEFYAARSMFSSMEDKSSELAHRGRATRIALKRWVGDAGDGPLATRPDIDRIRLRSGALEGDMTRHPEVALLEAQEDLAASELRVAQTNRQADSTSAAACQVCAYSDIELALARRDEARAAREEKLRDQIAQARIMIDEWQHARDRRDRYTREIAPLARERTQATLVAYRGGKSSLADILAARRAEIETELATVEAERDAALLWARLDFMLPETYGSTLPRADGGDSR